MMNDDGEILRKAEVQFDKHCSVYVLSLMCGSRFGLPLVYFCSLKELKELKNTVIFLPLLGRYVVV